MADANNTPTSTPIELPKSTVSIVTPTPVVTATVTDTTPPPLPEPKPLPEVNTDTSSGLTTFLKFAVAAGVLSVGGYKVSQNLNAVPPTQTPPAIVQEHVPVMTPVAVIPDPKIDVAPATDPKAEPTPAPTPTATPAASTIAKARRYYLVMNNSNGSLDMRLGGSVAWRYNNPGKFVYKKFAKDNGAIGSDGFMAIFSSYEAGRKALHDFLFDGTWKFNSLTVQQAIHKYFGQKSGTDLDDATTLILDDADFKGTDKFYSLTDAQKEFFIDKLQLADTWREGKVINFADQAALAKAGY